MNHQHKYFGIFTIVLALVCSGASPARAQSSVRMQISSQETYVGMPVTLQIQVENANATEPPEFPDVDGLDIRSTGTPSRSSSVTIVNGRRTESNSIIYSYRFTPRREGTFEIPSITIKTAQGPQSTRPVRISATTSETGDLMFAEVAGQKEHLYVGQPIDLTLRIWLKPFRDRKLNVTISASDMWRMVAQHTQWGAFAQTLEKMADEGKSIRGREVLREDNDGVQRSYYLYEVVATFYPKRAGQIDVENVRITAQYPTKLGQSRDPLESFFGDSPFGNMFDDDFFKSRAGSPFGRSLTVTASRPIVVTPNVAPIEVIPIPTADRPADYRGAVGQYQMITQATPVKVKAGDPITLKIGIRGTGPMELVQAPPLAEFPSLTADFKVSDEPLAGVVQDDIKVFTTTIRPRHERVSQVPSIPFSFFDPNIEAFVTVQSDPVSIEVSKAEKLALDSIVGSSERRKPGSSAADSADAGPVLENHVGREILTSQTSAPDPRFWLGWFLAPAALLGLLPLIRNRNELTPQSGARSAHKKINHAGEAREVARAILALISQKLGRHTGNLTRPEAIERITGLVDSATIHELESLLIDCENAAFTGDESISLPQTRQQARRLVSKLARMTRSVSVSPKVQRSWRVVYATALALVLIAVTAFSLITVFRSANDRSSIAFNNSLQNIELDFIQKSVLADEATVAYHRGIETKTSDAADSNSSFVQAAQKYQMLVDSGVHNSRLYSNLGNAYLQCDSVGRAIANYERALKLRPFDFQVRRNLDFALTLVDKQNANKTSTSGLTLGLIKKWLTDLPGSIWLTLLAIGWIGFCLSLSIRSSQSKFRVRYLTTPAVILVFAATGLIIWSAKVQVQFPAAVVVASDIPVYQGSSEAFPQSANLNITEGERVHVIQRRGDWLEIRSSTGDQGWTKAELLEQV